MKYFIFGRPGSGRKTLKEIIKNSWSSSAIIVENSSSDIKRFLKGMKLSDKIILVDTPVLLCAQRSGQNDWIKLTTDDLLLKHVTKLPNCTIVKNDVPYEQFVIRVNKIMSKY